MTERGALFIALALAREVEKVARLEARVDELLAANNREVERRRAAERRADDAERMVPWPWSA